MFKSPFAWELKCTIDPVHAKQGKTKRKIYPTKVRESKSITEPYRQSCGPLSLHWGNHICHTEHPWVWPKQHLSDKQQSVNLKYIQ